MESVIKVIPKFVLTYLVAPKCKVYYLAETCNGLKCVEDMYIAYHFNDRQSALLKADLFKKVFDVDFIVERIGE